MKLLSNFDLKSSLYTNAYSKKNEIAFKSTCDNSVLVAQQTSSKEIHPIQEVSSQKTSFIDDSTKAFVKNYFLPSKEARLSALTFGASILSIASAKVVLFGSHLSEQATSSYEAAFKAVDEAHSILINNVENSFSKNHANHEAAKKMLADCEWTKNFFNFLPLPSSESFAAKVLDKGATYTMGVAAIALVAYGLSLAKHHFSAPHKPADKK